MGLPQRKLFTIDEYLLLEENSVTKNELIHGEIYSMAGAKKNHVKITGNISYNLIHHLLNSDCDVYATDMKLKAGLDCYYPDVFITCEQEDNELVLEKAILIVEVLSDSTESFDKSVKLESYFQIPTLKEYLLVSQNKVEVWIYRRMGNKWELEIFNNYEDEIHLVSINLTIKIKYFYAKVFDHD
ncbi:Uma2 family endonuclease [Candidatus Halobeggiatoa sp. HSG11]|nr:Uma2 family endonuclease [Candidatus Halobeggiatoa sp. HSG11]